MAAVRDFSGPVLVDLDETLYLRNSTEDFIDTARPALAAYLLLKLLDVLRPWLLTGPGTRDVWRVRAVLLAFPWVLPLWRRRAAALARGATNIALSEALEARREPPVIVTLGFRPIVAPLLAAMGFGGARIVSARLWNAADRRGGKLGFLRRELDHAALRGSLCVTDSLEDMPVLDACALPLRTVWPEARFHPAFADLYLPGRYLTRIKRPNKHYIRRSILQDDFALWVLCSVWLAPLPLLHIAGLLCLLVSFWAIYEQGYVDNDRIAARFEADPRLSETWGVIPVATPSVAPWLWAGAAGFAGLALIGGWSLPDPLSAAIWAGVLLATALCFRLFNRLDKSTRIWPYGPLQLARCAAFAAVVPLVPMAPAAIGAHVVEKWVPYIVYRRGGGAAWDLPLHLMRLGFFLALILLIAATQGLGVLIEAPTLAFLAFTLFKARREIRSALARARWITRADRASAGHRQTVVTDRTGAR
ncbi:haloacid dehalogenase-like hydrolase [Paracoccus sp. S-4012]|uniref:haloacid dehalogenase-like hydrolase n=1 Tax=Paracoccus sp. S-4012 TaxID=2665648 RepID=UPI0018A22DE3|nr:haloacid dehalogenase-like hydrolase [Paracoccus sp. S-4012]